MKFTEYLERSYDARKLSHIVMLVGDDPVLKEVVIEDLGRLVRLWDQRERFEVKDVQSVMNLWNEGSLMGPRFLDVRIQGKAKNNKLWSPFLSQAPSNGNYMTVCFDGDEPDWDGILARPIFQVVECQFPKNIKTRTKLVAIRLRAKGCKLDDEMVKELAARVKSAVELESAITTLLILSRSSDRLTEQDITYAAGESDQFNNTSHALLMGNKVLLAQQLEGGDPLLILNIWHSTLKKLYGWINRLENPENDSDEEGDDGETQDDLRDFQVNRYSLRYYRVAQTKYSQTKIRALMEEINDVYQDVRIGKTGEWEERARIIISKMPT